MTVQCDEWVWGREQILWGFDPNHHYTLKVLEPKVGRAGCLSLQYHHQKSESWVVVQGKAWALIVVDGTVCTRVMEPGDVQHLSAGTWHRITSVVEGTQILEASTPDRHAADKQVPKDVVRLHCYHNRPVQTVADKDGAKIVAECVARSEQAMNAIAASEELEEQNVAIAKAIGPSEIAGFLRARNKN